MPETFLPHIVNEPQELEAIEAPPSPIAALLWLVFLVGLATSPAVVIALYRALL